VLFDLPNETSRILDRARHLAETSLPGRGRQIGLDQASWRAAADFGVFRAAGVRNEGNDDCGALASLAMLEGMGRGGAERGLLFAMGAHLFGCVAPFRRYASDAQVARWEGRLRSGAIIGALAVTESGGGSSLDHIKTVCVETAGGYRISGRKTLIGNAPVANLFLVLARQFADRGPLGFTVFLVPADSGGLAVTEAAATIGLPGSPMGDVVLNQCFAPSDAVLGAPGAGLRVFSTAMQWERSCLLAGFLGAAERDLAACVEALRTRGDGALLRHQAVSHRLARMKLRLDGARLLTYRAACRLDQGHDDAAAAAMAKLALSEALVANAEDGLRLLAGAAWQRSPHEMGEALNDALAGLFASGTSEMQLEILARSLQVESG
jgi:alkylation response protein AidB-like acyl-CoA dehydrogenase